MMIEMHFRTGIGEIKRGCVFVFLGSGTHLSGVRFRANSSDSGNVFELPQTICFVVVL